ncbi:MAG: tRNA pseudouridine(38-40) synthase TruA [Fimbriimonadaceae bacterium]|nr:tRNA pseudouridine(38-40) synthase TruA [Fimbriimonadaceae bacterium]
MTPSGPKRRIKLTVAYDGTDFCGWAAQAGRRTVQSTLTEAVRLVSGEEIEIVGASRTDSGAHARGQVCHFDTSRPISSEKWVFALNRVLPADLAVIRASNVPDRFHSRFCAKDRTYRYRIRVGGRDPFRSRYAHTITRPLDVERMRGAATSLLGRHDFRAYTEELAPHIVNTVRTLRKVEVSATKDEVRIEIVGTAFLRGMMRRMSGVLLEVGSGKRPVEDVGRLLDPNLRDGLTWPVVLPARGLTLMRVRYDRPLRDNRMDSDESDSAD